MKKTSNTIEYRELEVFVSEIPACQFKLIATHPTDSSRSPAMPAMYAAEILVLSRSEKAKIVQSMGKTLRSIFLLRTSAYDFLAER